MDSSSARRGAALAERHGHQGRVRPAGSCVAPARCPRLQRLLPLEHTRKNERESENEHEDENEKGHSSSDQDYQSFIDACFGGKLVSVIVCDTCKNVSDTHIIN